jgi:5'-3' exonuclease
VLAKFGHIEEIPDDWRTWSVNASKPAALARVLQDNREQAMLFKRLATLITDIPVFESVDDLRWNGPTPAFAALAAQLDGAVTAEPQRS